MLVLEKSVEEWEKVFLGAMTLLLLLLLLVKTVLQVTFLVPLS